MASIKLGFAESETERSDNFWNRSTIEMKFTVQKTWLSMVWECGSKPDYGMRNMDGILEERAGNKLELTGPLIDGYLREIGKCMAAKLGRSRYTGLMPPVRLYVPYTVFRHISNVCVGYGASFKSQLGRLMKIEIDSEEKAQKVFSPARFGGVNFLKKRHFDKIPDNGRKVQRYKGKAVVVVTSATPLTLEYKIRQEKLLVTFYIQRYDANDFALDLNLQKMVNE